MRILAFLTLILLISPVLAQQGSIDVNVKGVAITIEKGQKIQVDAIVKNTGAVTIDGFWISVYFQKPDGTFTDEQYFDYTHVSLAPGESHQATLKTNVIADQEGWWTVHARFRLNDATRTVIAQDYANFQVGGNNWIIGLLALTGVGLGGWYTIRRMGGR